MNLLPSEQLSHCTVRISCELSDGRLTTGTGFFFRCFDDGKTHVPVIVTNKHVIAGAKVGRFPLTTMTADRTPLVGQHKIIEVGNFENQWIAHPDPAIDLCVFPLAQIVKSASDGGFNFFRTTLSAENLLSAEELSDIGVAEDVLMIGYPNGIWDHVNNMPVLRRGMTATHPNLNYLGRSEFLIDAAVFPGSSGSPVLLYNANGWRTRSGAVIGSVRMKLLGILYAVHQHTTEGEVRVVEVPTDSRQVAVSAVPNNLGLVIKAEQLRAFDGVFERLRLPVSRPPQPFLESPGG